MKIKILPFFKKDLSGVLKLHLKLADFKHHLDNHYYLSSKEQKIKKDFVKYFQKKRSNEKIFVAKNEKNEIVGYIFGGIEKASHFSKEKKVGEIFQIFVEKDYRSKGIGLSLLKKILSWFKKKKIKIVQVESDAKNHSALLFYQKQGFKEKIKTLIKDLV